jgi:CRP-like cAMP-binding protein
MNKVNPISIFINKIDHQNLWDKILDLNRKEYLKVRGSIDTNLYIVVSGSLRIYVLDEFEENTIRFGYKDNFIASLDSFISEKPSDLYIQAIKKAKLKTIKKTTFINFIESSPENSKIWNLILTDLILQQMERERDLLTSSPIERYKRVLARSPKLFQEIPNKYIASYLRMTPETLSRIKKS